MTDLTPRQQLLEDLLVERFGPKPHRWPQATHAAVEAYEAVQRRKHLEEVALEIYGEESEDE